jgi:hypothetical protein
MDHQLYVSGSVDRVIHVSLTESEWQAFIACTPEPVQWLRERIREAINRSASGRGTNADTTSPAR